MSRTTAWPRHLPEASVRGATQRASLAISNRHEANRPGLSSASAVVVGYEASSNQNSACGGPAQARRSSGVHGSPSGASTARAKAESTTTATTLRRPPHGHCSTSVANTRRRTRPLGPARTRQAARRRRGEQCLAVARASARGSCYTPCGPGRTRPRSERGSAGTAKCSTSIPRMHDPPTSRGWRIVQLALSLFESGVVCWHKNLSTKHSVGARVAWSSASAS